MSAEQYWIEWSGGECPVNPSEIVDTRKRNGDIAYGFRADDRLKTGCWDRVWRGRRTDIVAYRVVQAASQ